MPQVSLFHKVNMQNRTSANRCILRTADVDTNYYSLKTNIAWFDAFLWEHSFKFVYYFSAEWNKTPNRNSPAIHCSAIKFHKTVQINFSNVSLIKAIFVLYSLNNQFQFTIVLYVKNK